MLLNGTLTHDRFPIFINYYWTLFYCVCVCFVFSRVLFIFVYAFRMFSFLDLTSHSLFFSICLSFSLSSSSVCVWVSSSFSPLRYLFIDYLNLTTKLDISTANNKLGLFPFFNVWMNIFLKIFFVFLITLFSFPVSWLATHHEFVSFASCLFGSFFFCF